MTVIKVKCPHCEKEHFVDVDMDPRTKKVAARSLDDSESVTKRFEEVVEAVLERHNGYAPLSIITIEASKKGLESALVKRMLNNYINSGKLRVENDNITW